MSHLAIIAALSKVCYALIVTIVATFETYYTKQTYNNVIIAIDANVYEHLHQTFITNIINRGGNHVFAEIPQEQ